MRWVFAMAVAAVMTFVLAAADVSGTWVGAMDTPGGVFSTTIQLQSGATLTGTVKTDMFEGKIEKAKLDGDKISFELNIEQGRLLYEGTVAGDELKLTVTGTTGNKYPMVCKRQK